MFQIIENKVNEEVEIKNAELLVPHSIYSMVVFIFLQYCYNAAPVAFCKRGSSRTW